MLKGCVATMAGPRPPPFCPPTCLPTKLWIGNVRGGVGKPDVLAFFRGLGITGATDMQVVHREHKDSSLIVAFQYDWQAAHAMEALRSAGEWCPIRSESGLLKVRYKESDAARMGRYISNAYLRL